MLKESHCFLTGDDQVWDPHQATQAPRGTITITTISTEVLMWFKE